MAETSVSIVLTICVLRLHHAGPEQAEMAPLVRRLVFRWLARIGGGVDRSRRPRRADLSAACHSTRDKLASHPAGQMTT